MKKQIKSKLFANMVQGDSLTVLKRMDDSSVDAIVTSPPYNIGITYGDGSLVDDKRPEDRYMNWMSTISFHMNRVLRPGGSLFFNIGGRPSDQAFPMRVLMQALYAWNVQNVIHWVKSISVIGVTHGHFKPINSPRFVNDTHEYIFHLTKDGKAPIDRLAIGVPYSDKSNVERWSGKRDLRCRGNCWYVPYKTVQSSGERGHPSTFPVALPEMALKLAGLTGTGALVLDPFAGTGATALAAAQVGCSFLGIEIVPQYVQAAVNRYKFYSGNEMKVEVLGGE